MTQSDNQPENQLENQHLLDKDAASLVLGHRGLVPGFCTSCLLCQGLDISSLVAGLGHLIFMVLFALSFIAKPVYSVSSCTLICTCNKLYFVLKH